LFVGDLVSLLPIIAIVVVFWLFVIAPASRRQKATTQMQSAIAVGDDVVLTAGIFGTVSGIEDSYLLVELAPGVDVKVARSAVGAVVPEDYDESDPDGTADDVDDADAEPDTEPTPELDTDSTADTSATDTEER
jgi:preprotein translocase subunit YajC